MKVGQFGLVLAQYGSMPNGVRSFAYLCSELVTVEYVAANEGCRSRIANLEAIDDDKAMLLAEGPIATGTHVRISCHGADLCGVVEGCNADDLLGYSLEITLDPWSRWTESWFRPEHLLALWQGMESGSRTASHGRAA